MRVSTRVNVDASQCVYMCVRLYACTRACVYVCVCVSVCSRACVYVHALTDPGGAARGYK